MIYGGVNAAGKCAGLRCGYTEKYLPCSVLVMPQTIIDAIEQSTGIGLVWRAEVRIVDMAGTGWTDLGSASYFQVTRNLDGTLDTADVTLQQPEIWSAYLSTHPDLLLPSTRQVQIRAGLVIGGTWYSVPVFAGRILSYSESIGANGGAISLRLEDVREALTRATGASMGIAKATAFRTLLSQSAQFTTIKANVFNGGGALYRITVSFGDVVHGTVAQFGLGSILDCLARSFPGVPLLKIQGSGMLSASSSTSAEKPVAAFSYADKNIHTATRNVSDNTRYNVYKIYGLVGAVGTAGEVTDAADILLRGRVVWPNGYVGSETIEYTDAQTIAQGMLDVSLRGVIQAEVPFNPYLTTGQYIGLSSTRLGITTPMLAKVVKMNSQYSVGRARTYFSELRAFTP
jgi:hypothetical protein